MQIRLRSFGWDHAKMKNKYNKQLLYVCMYVCIVLFCIVLYCIVCIVLYVLCVLFVLFVLYV